MGIASSSELTLGASIEFSEILSKCKTEELSELAKDLLHTSSSIIKTSETLEVSAFT